MFGKTCSSPAHNTLKLASNLCYCNFIVCMFSKVGKGCTGKSSVVRTLAELTGHQLLELPMSSVTDTTDLLGGYEQVDCIYCTLRC